MKKQDRCTMHNGLLAKCRGGEILAVITAETKSGMGEI
jgi:hypothetical protein